MGAAARSAGEIELDRSGWVPTFPVTVVSRVTKAINYRHRSGSTPVDLRGTALMPMAKGQATSTASKAALKSTPMDHLTPATQFGPEYLTYVLWACDSGRAAKFW